MMKRAWAMPNKWTFKIKPIKELINKYVGDGMGWIDPFSGMNSPAEITNDHRLEMPTKYHLDAVDFSEMLIGEYKGVLFDPPYSIHEVKRHYDSMGKKYDFLSDPTCSFKIVKDNLSEKINLGGIAISCGWNSNGFGKKRGFKIVEILLVAHGGGHNDTIVVVEVKGKKMPKAINLELGKWFE